MSDDREIARELPLAMYRMIVDNIHADISLRRIGTKEAFKYLEIPYSQLMDAKNGKTSIGHKYFENFLLSQSWLSSQQKTELQSLFEKHRDYWDWVDGRKKDRTSNSIGKSDVLAFKRIVNERFPDIAKRISPYYPDIEAFTSICEIFIEEERISGRSSNALLNGQCICCWIEEINDDSIDTQILLASALRLTLYSAFYVHDQVCFQKLLKQLRNLSEKTKHPWIVSAQQQNERRFQVNFQSSNRRDIKSIILSSEKANEAANVSKKARIPKAVNAMWGAMPILAQQAYVQSLILSRQIQVSHLVELKSSRDKIIDEGFRADATLITNLVIAEGYIYLNNCEVCQEFLSEVEMKIANNPHKYHGINAVFHRISGDLALFRFVESRKNYSDFDQKALEHYNLSK